MAGMFDYTPAPKARRMAVIFTLVTAIFCVLSQMGFNFGRVAIPFIMLPSLVVYLWPKGANPLLSLIGIFVVGLLQDHLSYGPTGLWALTWMALFLIYRPDVREKSKSLLGQWIGVLLVLMCIVIFQWGLARFVLGRSIDMWALVFSAVAAFGLFPLFYILREYAARTFGDKEGFYYEAPTR